MELFANAAAELRAAADHLDVAVRHFQAGDIPRACAHAFAAQGHQSQGASALDEATRVHARNSRV
jgi:hypothetical protein